MKVIRSLQRRLAAPPNHYLGLALGFYILLVGVLLLSSEFLPYVTDNNESFSMFIHARNMLRFGLGYDAGLSDESYAIHPAGHPYVYTHEGNFPRLPVYLLLLLGVTKIEWQIVLHALVLGTATIYLCFRFFSRICDPLFAFIVCATLTTDYLLFMQWEVNTFRVWHGLFFFLPLVCVQSIEGVNHRKAEQLLFLAFVGVFYFEIVFAIFTLAVCFFYALLMYWRRWRLALRVLLTTVAGGAVALCGLLGQSVAYLGWSVAWRDIQLTLLSRNFYGQTFGEARGLNRLGFFLEHHIVYWLDNPDTRGYLSVGHFLDTIGASVLRIYTPYLILMVWILTIALMLRMGLSARASIRLGASPSFSDKEGAYHPRRGLVSGLTGYLALLAVIYAAVSFALGFLVVDLRGLLRLVNPDVVRIQFMHLVWAFPEGARRILSPLWLGAIQDYFGDRIIQAGLLASVMLALVIVLEGGRRYLRMRNNRSFVEVLRYLAAGGVAFVFIYILSPGYLWAGYLDRYAPLPVFIVDVWIALFFYMLVVITWASGREVAATLGGCASGTVRRRAFSPIVAMPHFMFALSLFLLILGSIYWVRVQAVYTNTLPPTSFQTLRKLGQGEYKGTTFISNNYSAPIAYYTENWAYMDSMVSENIYRSRSGATIQMIGGEYLWEADRASNTDYLHPQYYMCIASPYLDTAARLFALHGRGRLSNCSSQPLIRDAHAGVGPFSNVLVASDPSPRDVWAIVKLDPSIQFTLLH